jgi:polyketide-type polyunsaturated fatty acid synthase PfaA
LTNAPLAIVGMGCLFPKANSVDEYWSNIKNLVDCIGDVPGTHWSVADYFDADPKRPDHTYARRGGFLSPYPFRPAEFGISPRDLEAIDTAQLLGLVVAKMALEDAGLLAPGVDRRRVSTILGVTGTLELVIPLGARLGHPLWKKAMRAAGIPDDQIEDAASRIASGYVGWQENSFPGLLGNVVAGRIANRLDLGGTNCVVDAACASSLSALHLAALELQAGRADAVLTGGVDTFNDIFMYMCFSKTPALSPTGDAKPLSARSDGTILGEGLGMIVLKRLADAQKAGDRIYAVILGIGTSSDGAGNAVYAPTAPGQIRCLENAYAEAGVSPATIGLVEAHGTGTKVGDATEIQALSEVFRSAGCGIGQVNIGAVKAQIGHTKAAAGIAGLIKCALALHHRTIPPTAKVDEPAPALIGSPFSMNDRPRPWLRRDGSPRRAGVSSFGFGGSNFHCVLEEAPSATPVIDWDGDVTIAAFSGPDRAALRERLRLLARFSEWSELRHEAARTRSTFDPTARYRLVLTLTRSDATETIEKAESALGGPGPVATPGSSVFFGEGRPGRLAALFPGQGAQTVGMLREMALRFPAFQSVLEQADEAFAEGQGLPGSPRLSDLIYPPAAYSAEARANQEAALRDTRVAQPALGAVCLGAMRVLQGFGVRPDAAAGHSYGELTALCTAGRFDAAALFQLSQLRGRLMANGGPDAGAMLAVMAPLGDVESILADDRMQLVIANRNSPQQAVLSGPRTEISRAEESFGRRKIRHVRLPVAAAFHSPLVADASRPFRQALEPVEFADAELPVYSNSTSREYPRDPTAARDLLASQLAQPVDFLGEIRNMAESGVTTFVEVGPGATLTKLVSSILADRPHEAVAIDASAGRANGLTDLARALSRLAAIGHPVDLSAWDPSPPEPRPSDRPGLVVPICGANYRSPRKDDRPARPQPRTPASTVEKPMAETPRHDLPSEAIRLAQESLAAFERLQQQTAELHRVFLEQQTEAQKTLQAILAAQQRIISGGAASAANGIPSIPATPARPAIAPPRSSPPAAPVAAPQVAPVKPVAAAVAPTPTPQRPAAVANQPRPAAAPRPEAPAFAPASKPAPPKSPAPATGLTDDLLAIVADKTGYPVEMLGLDMGLDADLGIDSIKRVEILSAVQEKYPHLPVVPPDRLGSLRSLRDVLELLQESPAAPAPTSPTGSDAGLQNLLLEVVADKTGYPVEMLGLDMSLDADLGIDSIKRVEILSAVQERRPDLPSVPPDRLGSLRTLREVLDLFAGGPEKKAARPASVPR